MILVTPKFHIFSWEYRHIHKSIPRPIYDLSQPNRIKPNLTIGDIYTYLYIYVYTHIHKSLSMSQQHHVTE